MNKGITMYMRKHAKAIFFVMIFMVAAAFLVKGVPAFAAEGAADAAEYTPKFYATFWSIVPFIVAISLALITKEVYSSLFIGIAVGALLYSDFSFEGTVLGIFNYGVISEGKEVGIISVLTSPGNVGILIFLVILGSIVALMNKAGGSKAFGEWAAVHIKTKVGAELATIFLGCLIFIDDYFNCLTVGSVMRPVTDKHKISRAKFAYLIDATAAPVCIIAPVSSWAAAVNGFVDGEDGLSLFVRAIPYNFYALLTILMMVLMAVLKVEFGSMAKHEYNAEHGDLFTTPDRPYAEADAATTDSKGKVIDLIIPIASLVICCVTGIVYTGGFFSGESFITAFSNSDASLGLALGSFFGILITIIIYLIRRVLSFNECMACLADGFKAMVPAILILTFAWTLKSVTDGLGAKEFVATSMQAVSGDLMGFLPAIIFLVGCFLAFATGTSWGTFGILIPIVVGVFEGVNYELMIVSISACMAGAVCGDHCSPISDTTIMASAGAQCNHVNHVSTQLPYAMMAASVSFVAYIFTGLLANYHMPAILGLPLAMAMMVGVVIFLKAKHKSALNKVNN